MGRGVQVYSRLYERDWDVGKPLTRVKNLAVMSNWMTLRRRAREVQVVTKIYGAGACERRHRVDHWEDNGWDTDQRQEWDGTVSAASDKGEQQRLQVTCAVVS